MNINELIFDENGLIPAIIADAKSKEVLTLAYMNKESLEISLKEKRTCFYSRKRQTLWRKGETSGNFQNIISITSDCDNDALLITVIKEGPACHTGQNSCFFNNLYTSDVENSDFSISSLASLIKERKRNPKDGSYTNYLFEKGLDKILKKIGEESSEVIIGAKNNDKEETIYEIADLTYHILVLMSQMGILTDEVLSELKSRHIIDAKIKQEKMT
ncbi:MAG: bifunctional phosphoribosyl-AMP cyclohydrolase/phosphoribosyl-ATP diphosphatase HisIE [Clostridiales bacterium]|jgi:phosphoribosyl-ATP pyrophosphohydrolase/phosphoribosyl-AMP cyclohydrolase|nr:bifunctional phosphoribosyl-AMP cyclohydrolase/phosphoribosyl-ATP diphosphatase HisIE [Clostridiales bacterium]